MRPGVTAILVARDASRALERTIAALESSSRVPDRVVMVNLASKDSTLDVMRAAGPDILLTLETDTTFGGAVAEAVTVLEEQGLQAEGDWLWLLAADNAPEHDALEQLLATAERNPSLEVTGPKLVRSDDAATLVEFGQSMLQNGESLASARMSWTKGSSTKIPTCSASRPAGCSSAASHGWRSTASTLGFPRSTMRSTSARACGLPAVACC